MHSNACMGWRRTNLVRRRTTCEAGRYRSTRIGRNLFTRSPMSKNERRRCEGCFGCFVGRFNRGQSARTYPSSWSSTAMSFRWIRRWQPNSRMVFIAKKRQHKLCYGEWWLGTQMGSVLAGTQMLEMVLLSYFLAVCRALAAKVRFLTIVLKTAILTDCDEIFAP